MSIVSVVTGPTRKHLTLVVLFGSMLGLVLQCLFAQDCTERCACVSTLCFDSYGGNGTTWLDEYSPNWCDKLYTSGGQDGDGDNSFAGDYRGEVREGYLCGCPNLEPSTVTKETGAAVDDGISWESATYFQYCNSDLY